MAENTTPDPERQEQIKEPTPAPKRSGGSSTPAVSTLRNKALRRIGTLLDEGLDNEAKVNELNALVQAINYGLHDPSQYDEAEKPPAPVAEPVDIDALAKAVLKHLKKKRKKS